MYVRKDAGLSVFCDLAVFIAIADEGSVKQRKEETNRVYSNISYSDA